MRETVGAPGAIAVVLDGDERWAAAVGSADLDGTPAQVPMRFRAGSITKTVVAAVVLDLADQGVVNLDGHVDAVIPGVLRPDPPVTIRQLLGHTSGLYEEPYEGESLAFAGAIVDPGLRAEAEAMAAAYSSQQPVVIPDRVIVALAETQPRSFDPGEGWHYSNTGYQVVGMVVERATGRPLSDALSHLAADVVGLGSFSLAPDDRTSPELRGYARLSPDRHQPVSDPADGDLFDFTDALYMFGNGAAAGLLTTADDLAVFFRELLGGRVLSPAALAEMMDPSEPSERLGFPYGLGLFAVPLSCGLFWGHTGDASGTQSIALADSGGNRVVVIAFNSSPAVAGPLFGLADLLVCGG